MGEFCSLDNMDIDMQASGECTDCDGFSTADDCYASYDLTPAGKDDCAAYCEATSLVSRIRTAKHLCVAHCINNTYGRLAGV